MSRQLILLFVLVQIITTLASPIVARQGRTFALGLKYEVDDPDGSAMRNRSRSRAADWKASRKGKKSGRQLAVPEYFDLRNVNGLNYWVGPYRDLPTSFHPSLSENHSIECQLSNHSLPVPSPSFRRSFFGGLPLPPYFPTLQAVTSASSLGSDTSLTSIVTTVKDQASCGTCVAFGTVGATEASYRFQTSQGTVSASSSPDWSEYHLYYCDGSGTNCNSGWYLSSAANAVVNKGLYMETCQPYQAYSTATCTSNPAVCTTSTTSMGKWTSIYFSTVQDILNHISTKGPVLTAFTVYSDFPGFSDSLAYQGVGYSFPDSYVYPGTKTGKALGGHAVHCYGFNQTAGYVMCKNSWGTGWGASGHFKISIGADGILGSAYGFTWSPNVVSSSVAPSSTTKSTTPTTQTTPTTKTTSTSKSTTLTTQTTSTPTTQTTSTATTPTTQTTQTTPTTKTTSTSKTAAATPVVSTTTKKKLHDEAPPTDTTTTTPLATRTPKCMGQGKDPKCDDRRN